MPEVSVNQSATDHPAQALTGRKVGRFVIGPRVGAGGMGEVYRAEDPKLKRPVALKRVAPRLRADPVYRGRLLKEAQRASALNDEHIARIYDVLEEEDEILLVMEYVDGATLRERLRKPLPAKAFLGIAIQCVRALVAAHEKGIVHCDIKPENIMLTAGDHVRILDFGVARRLPTVLENATTETLDSRPGMLMGTPAYLAPEVLQGRPPDGRADLFSLGVVFYEALSGRHPFLASTFVATTDRILHETPATLAQLNPEVPPELEHVVAKLLAKDPADRYATAADLLVDLRALARALNYPALVATPSTPWVPDRRHTWAVRVAILLTLAVAVALVVWLWIRRPPVTAEREFILVTDFENRTGEKLFDRTVSPLLCQALLQSRFVSVVPRLRVLEAARRTGRANVTVVDASLGREICQREGYRALLSGQIIPSGSDYQLVVQVVNSLQGLPVITETETIRSPADLYDGVDRLSGRLRRRLGESLAQIEKGSRPLAQVTTPSLEALERYSRAVDLFATRDIEGSVALAEGAVERDPDFAMAHVLLLHDYEYLGNEKKALQHLALARQGLDRVTERERHLILALDYSAKDLEARAAEQYRLLLELDPNDVEALRGLAESSFWTGQAEEAIQAERKAVQLSPFSAHDYIVLMNYLVRLSRFREALTAYEQARANKVESPQLHTGAGLALWGEGNTDAARREFDLLRQGGGTVEENLAQLYLARLLTYEGRMREADEALRAGLILDEKQHSEAWVPVRLYLLMRVALVRGKLGEARALARKLGGAVRAEAAPENLQRAGWLALELGDSASARSFLGLLNDQLSQQENEKAFTRCLYFNLKGDVELAEGNSGAAIESQNRASIFLKILPEPYASLGRAYGAQRNWAGAIHAYEQYLQFKGPIFRDGFPGDWVLTHLRLAQTFKQSGDTQQALHYYDEFLRLWAKTDADLPILQEASAERQSLAAEASQSLH